MPRARTDGSGRVGVVRGAPNASEAQIQRLITDYLSLRGIVFSITDASRIWDSRGRVRRGKVIVGWPDVTCCVRGKFVGLEVKSKTGRLRPEQKACHEALREAGGIVAVVRSLDDVIAILAGLT